MAGVCGQHGCPEYATSRGHCRAHARVREHRQRRSVPTKATRTRAEQQRRTDTVDAHVRAHGWACPGDEAHPAHPCTDLTAHHTDAVGSGGDPSGRLAVLCRSRNSAIGQRTS